MAIRIRLGRSTNPLACELRYDRWRAFGFGLDESDETFMSTDAYRLGRVISCSAFPFSPPDTYPYTDCLFRMLSCVYLSALVAHGRRFE
jgi:hypothetical protein